MSITRLTFAFCLLPAVVLAEQNAFLPGQVWLDTDGNPIQAHSAGVLWKDGVYYWYGENKSLGGTNRVGVSCYSSRDLYHWKNEGVVLPKDALPEQYRDRGVCERAKVLFHAKSGQYVMWMHLDGNGYKLAEAGVAVSSKPAGPFRFLRSFRPIRYTDGEDQECCDQKELGGTYRDMNLFLDDDGRAYVFYASESNYTMYVSRLDASFTGIEEPAVKGKTWDRILVRKQREAPAPFKYNGRYYLLTSGCTGWAPNQATYSVASSILGPWTTPDENPMIGPDAEKTFLSQSTFVLPAPGKRKGDFIVMLDRWNPKQLGDSRYVWLPLRMNDTGQVRVEWRDRWDLSVFEANLR